ncbi:hypothetical protein TanjilG_24922 [Lupinus angustifolius]|uniref:UDP-galactose/UDP-glucose transporter 2-like n=1 Tax=Lupinus angustifolius TaxID=3871 RepID=A0A4P1R051_LUPAN|nr:hypothetical protein TanjilG_24922 [Lupinus angustifolius]
MKKNEEQGRSLFGISLTDRPRWHQFLICSSGFFFGYLVNGICEEYVYNRLHFSYGWYFTFIQGFVYLFLIYLQGFTSKQMVNPWKTYVKLSAVLMGSHGLTKGSLAFLNYPAQIMFKSTKVLPVMIMGAFIPGLRRKYPLHEYISAILLVVGLILFTLADAQTSPNFSVIGVAMISGALVMDSFLGNLQEAIFTMNPETTQMEMLFCSTIVGLPFLIPPMLFTGELFKAWTSCAQKNEEQGRSLFGISLTDRPRWHQFLICSSGFFFGYLVNGICEEYVYNRLHFSYGWYFTFIQGFVYLFLIYLQGFTSKQMVNPWKTYVKLSAVLMGSHGLTKGSLAFLNYPAQIMFKSTKVLPVMIMGAFIPGLRRKYPLHEYISAILLVVGLILFTLADAQTSPNFSVIGVAMISGALVMDSFLGNLQEAIFTMNPETTQMEMLFCSTIVGLPFLIPPMLFTGELFKAWTSCAQHPYVYGVLVFEAMATFIGQVSVLSLIALFGAATTAMITTARKAVTLLLSYLIFTKPLTEQHGSGLLLIAMGITLKMLPENKPISTKRVLTTSHSSTSEKYSGDEELGENEEKRPLV